MKVTLVRGPVRATTKTCRGRRPRRPAFERLEPRVMLDATPIISEFMAANGATLADGRGAFEDWIEIHNPTGAAVELDGWYLTDDPADLTQWPLPAVSLAAGDYLIVFASGRDEIDHVDPDGNPHTNFKLDTAGDSLALVAPDGTTIADAYWHYPEQRADVSYGVAVDTLVASGAMAEILVPADGSLATTWTALDFTPEVAWTAGPTGVGYDVSTAAGSSTPLKVDLGESINSGPTQSGWESIEHEGTSPVTRSFPHDELAGPGNSVVVTVSGQTHWRDYAPATGIFAPLSNLLSDGPLANAPATIALDLQNLLSGTYEITTYHHTTEFGPSARPPATPFDVYLTDGLVTDDPIVVGAVMSDNNSSALRTETFQFTVVDGSPVRIAFDRGQSVGQGDHFALPGFELTLLTEARVGDFITTDIETQLHGHGTSAYLRTAFEAAVVDDVQRLALRIKYDDGFAAYLNGTPIAARNAPSAPAFNATATQENPVEQAVRFEEIDVSDFRGALRTGTNVLAIHGLNLLADDDDFLILPELVATRTGDSAYMTASTPGRSNAPGYSGLVADTQFSVDRGFYTDPFDVEITTETPESQIRYTLDGSRPTETTGTPYTEPITIAGLTTLRAAAFKPDHIPTNVDTHTYVFLDDVVVQNGAGFPTGWGIGADYAMEDDPGDLALIAGDSLYTVEQARQVVADSLLALPTLSIVLDTDGMFGSAQGIYANTEGRGFTWERPTSVELIYADGTPGFQQDAGIRIQGFTSRDPGRNPKHSLRLIFRSVYGAGQLDYPFFGGTASLAAGGTATDRFDTIVLRS
ncbi:MAG: chitobiase/beta-hexosaminidase C-terminal domain-containing protein, partial [Candidatus Nealsonbacteria bacterium]|nr:chitobiase/beta-hexosaminidase C-terminal domain-containing protein [Candidatus Nealsonbacteria bacterium]